MLDCCLFLLGIYPDMCGLGVFFVFDVLLSTINEVSYCENGRAYLYHYNIA
jgi:hypothetical protein